MTNSEKITFMRWLDKKRNDTTCLSCRFSFMTCGRIGCAFKIMREIVEQEEVDTPAVDAVPVVHGKWMHDNYGVNFCSECLKFAYEDEEYRMIWHTNFCPHCGAKMDEKDGENNEN